MLKDTNFFPKQSLEVYEKLKTADENGQLDEAVAGIFTEEAAANINLVTIWRNREYLCKLSDEISEKSLKPLNTLGLHAFITRLSNDIPVALATIAKNLARLKKSSLLY